MTEMKEQIHLHLLATGGRSAEAIAKWFKLSVKDAQEYLDAMRRENLVIMEEVSAGGEWVETYFPIVQDGTNGGGE